MLHHVDAAQTWKLLYHLPRQVGHSLSFHDGTDRETGNAQLIGGQCRLDTGSELGEREFCLGFLERCLGLLDICFSLFKFDFSLLELSFGILELHFRLLHCGNTVVNGLRCYAKHFFNG